jgi:tetratricopeptide (TPR) repeat protein
MLRQAKYVPISRKRRRSPLFAVVFSVLLLGVLVVLGLVFRVDRLFTRQATGSRRVEELVALWNGRSYQEIINRCDEYLVDDPLDGTYLSLKGFASFYKADELGSAEERAPYLDQAVVSLRRARVAPKVVWSTENDYILGKTYFLKGKYYYDLAVRSLEQALSNGYKGEDSHEYLGAAYERLGDLRRGLEHYLKAANEKPGDALYLTIAMVYYQLKDSTNAEEYFIRAKGGTDDPEVAKKSRLMLASIYLDRSEFIKAEGELKDILSFDPESADAYFGLGEVYRRSGGDQAQARAMYRKTLQLDPSHVGAKLQYYGR